MMENPTEIYFTENRFMTPEENGLQDLLFSNLPNISADNFLDNDNVTNVNFFGFTDFFDSETSQWIQFILAGVFLTVVAILGIFGNILSISVLSQRKMHSSLSILLINLSVCDLLVCALMAFAFGVPQILIKVDESSEYLRWLCTQKRILFPLLQTVQLGSTYFIVGVTAERFIAVCFPLKSRSICTFKNALWATFLIPIFCVVTYIPQFYTYYSREEHYNSTTFICTSIPNEESMSKGWKTARLVIYILIPYLIPLATVIIVNVFIVRKICQKNAERDVLTQHRLKEIKLTNMLIVVVLVYVICNIFRLVNSFTNNIFGITYAEATSLTNFLVTFNSAVNYLIYCAYGKSFRESFVILFCKCGKRRKLQRNTFKQEFEHTEETATTELSIMKSIRRFSKSVITSFGN